jgi:hypothetical protein
MPEYKGKENGLNIELMKAAVTVIDARFDVGLHILLYMATASLSPLLNL